MAPGLIQGIILGLLMLLAMSFPAVRWVKCLRYLLRSRNGPAVVISKRIEPPKASPYPIYDKYSENKFMYFENYGWFPSPEGDYPDLDRAYRCATVQWWDSEKGDAFYLVLDGNLNVVHIYPCKRYSYTGPVTAHTVVNGKIQRTEAEDS